MASKVVRPLSAVCVVILAGASVLTSSGEAQEPVDGWETWDGLPTSVRQALAANGTLVVVALDGVHTIPLFYSSRIGHDTDEDRPLVMRGYSIGGDASAIAILARDNATFIVNVPGEDTFKIHLVPEGVKVRQRSSLLTADPLGSGAIRIQDSNVTVPLSAPGHLGSGETGEVVASHMSPVGGQSIATSKAIHTPGKIEAIDPVNVVVYHHATFGLMSTTMGRAGWDQGVCGSAKSLWVFDAMHQGIDSWVQQQENWGKESAFCIDGRYHARQYSSPVGDTHDLPAFVWYTVLPVHYEPFSHLGGINPQRGQDELAKDFAGVSEVGNIRHFAAGAGGCSSCGNWGGVIDFHERMLVTAGHPSHADPCGSTTDDRHSVWTAQGFTKIKFWCA